jgi:hypothetical protein
MTPKLGTCLCFALAFVLALSGCASAPEGPRAMPGRATAVGDRVGGYFEVLSVREEPAPSGGTRVVYRVRNECEHRVFQIRATLERVVCETGAVASSSSNPVDYVHHGEEIDVEFAVPPDPRPAGTPALANRLVISLL